MKHVMDIREGWQLQGLPYRDFSLDRLREEAWLPARVPGDVHTNLMENGVITDPSLGMGDVQAAWVERQVWVYRVTVRPDAAFGGARRALLRFAGLDTLCDVFWDGRQIASFANMLVEHVCVLPEPCGAQPHTLQLVFWPVCERSRKEELPEGFWINYSPERAWIRKAAYSFGWDWTPRIVTCGVWRPVSLENADESTLTAFRCTTLAADGAEARIAVQARATGGGRVRVRLKEGDTVACEATLDGLCGELTLPRPRLWWTHDQGEPYLYRVEAELLDADGRVMDTYAGRLGVRTLRMQTHDAQGKPCYVTVLNGRPIFLRGANWVPLSNRPATVTPQRYDYTLTMAAEAGMNALALWGGGLYEADAFYDLCDEKGLLCWQYFMFACGEYPDADEAFVQTVHDEVEKVVDRLAGHACIALWIGNVENEMLSDKIGLERPMHGARLFEQLLPEWLKTLDPTRPYVPSSPWGGDTPNSMEQGDRHLWNVWFEDLPYTAYRQDETTFASEFGLHAAPVLDSIRAFTGGEEPTLQSFLFRYMNRDQSLERMAYYLETYTGRPQTLREYIQSSMQVQADGLACGSEHFRRRFPQCGGALIWQLNDCCLAHSWSLIDARGIPKQAYYESKRFFDPVMVSLLDESPTVTEIWVTNDRPEAFRGAVTVEVGSFTGQVAHREQIEADVAPGESRCVRTLAVGGRFWPNVILANRPRLYYLAAMLQGQERPTVRFFELPKNLLLPEAKLQFVQQEQALHISTDLYARQVRLDGEVAGLWMSDNWFDMLPGTQRDVRVRVLWGEPLENRALTLTASNGEELPLHWIRP